MLIKVIEIIYLLTLDPWEEDCRDEISSESPGSSHHHRGKSLVLNYVAGKNIRMNLFQNDF